MAEDSLKKDLNWIKKYYGEKMMHMCRSLFPQILEVPGALPRILENHFTKSRYLVDDIQAAGKENYFKALIFNYFDNGERRKFETNKSAVELMDEAGYILYPECQTEEDIQVFKKYYAPGEELCTFWGNRLDSCRVWFAVKKDVENIKREGFTKPQREDDYGTSVISIQFSRGDNSTLSIKNRYNHTVVNPDNTFYSNLENIALGLTSAFENDYGAVVSNMNYIDFELKDYVCVNRKYYHYNYEINNIYYCDGGVIIDNFNVKQLDPNSQILMDYFVVDLKNKTIKLYDDKMNDSFVNSLGEITNITKQGNTLTISVKDGENVVIGLNDRNQMISLYNPNVKDCGHNFLKYNITLTELNLPNLKSCKDDFLLKNNTLTELNLPNLEICGSSFLNWNSSLTELNLPNLKSCEILFLNNNILTKLNLPKLESCGDYFLVNNNTLTELNLPNLKSCRDGFLRDNNSLTELNLPKLESCGNSFLSKNRIIKRLSLPNLESCGNDFLLNNNTLTELNLPNLEICGSSFLNLNNTLIELNLLKLESCGNRFLNCNNKLTELNLPKIVSCGNGFLSDNNTLTELNLPKLESCGHSFLGDNNTLTELNLPKLESCGDYFLFYNNTLTELNLPKLESCGDYFLSYNDTLRKLVLQKSDKKNNDEAKQPGE